MSMPLRTVWQGQHLLVLRDEEEIDRLAACDVQRVVLVCRHGGETPSDLRFAVIETLDDHVLLPADSGIAGRVHFERQVFWAQRACVYWVDEARAQLPRLLRPGLWMLRRQQPGYMRLPRAQLQAVIDTWPLEGPQTWEQRKWERIVRSRLLKPWQPQRHR
jgi:hypothetical protein